MTARALLAALRPMACVLLVLLWPHQTVAAQPGVTIAGPLPAERMSPTLERLAAAFPDVDIVYRRMRSTQIAAALRAHGSDRPDIVILSTPDIAVSLTNDGLAARLTAPGPGNWRGELQRLVNDPAVFVYRPEAFADTGPPRTRLGLALFLEQSPAAAFQRVGIVNIGIDSVAYALASQDSLRSPMFWRLATAFGSTQARIYNSEHELLDALAAGQIDFGYNVPLSSVIARPSDAEGLRHLFPEDYVVSLPWTLLARRDDTRRIHLEIATHLLSDQEGDLFGLSALQGFREQETMTYQPIPLGPELLVFLDRIKRSRFLDTWFQMVTSS